MTLPHVGQASPLTPKTRHSSRLQGVHRELPLPVFVNRTPTRGGGAGLRDRGLLESAVAQPQASFGGTFAPAGLFEMAAAYLFHIVSNHPFVHGNKRTGLLAAQVSWTSTA